MPDTIGTLVEDLETHPGSIPARHRRTHAHLRDGLRPRNGRLTGLIFETESLEGPLGELKLALVHGSNHSQHDPQQFISAPYPGFLLCQDNRFVANIEGVGDIKGLGNLFLHTVVDAHCSLAFAKLYHFGSAGSAVDILQDRVLPFYAQQGLKIERLLTDNGRAYGRKFDARYLYEALLIQNGIEHLRCDSLPAAADNPLCAQFYRVLEHEFFLPALRKNFNLHLETLQVDLDAFLKNYNCVRPCPGVRTRGRTPFRAFLDALASQPSRCVVS